MAKREKIILLIMSLVVMFGLYDFLFSSDVKKKPAVTVTDVAATQKFIAEVAGSLKDDFTKTNMYILSRAKDEWRRDPFWQKDRRPEAKAEAKEESVREIKVQESRVYTGYLEMGEQKLAIINGAEYELGDELGRGGPVVKNIDPKQVILAVPGTADEIILPLKETK